MPIRKYSSRSQQTTLVTTITSTAATMTVTNAAALMGGKTVTGSQTYTVVIDPDTALEEIVDVTVYSSGNTLNITRGVDGPTPGTGVAHSPGAIVRHMAIGRDYQDSNDHIEKTTGTIHGIVVADIVKVTDTGTVATGMIATNAVTTAKITDLNVTTAKIADSAVTSAKIADLTIATGDIADSAITSAKIADLTIATGDIADGAITSAKIADGTIVVGDIADGAITSAKILNDTIVNADINSAAAIAYSKLNLAGSVTSSDIVDGTIVNADVNTSAQIAYGKLNLTNTIVNADINASAAIALSKLATDPLARANHTGTQLAATVSDFDTQVRTSRLDQMTAPTASVSLNSQKITSLATPTLSTDAATKAYADLMIPLTQKGAASGVAELDADGLLPANRLPSLSITTTQVVATQAAMLALTAQTGDVAVRTDLNKTFILTASPATTLGNWQELLTPTDAVLSVDGQTGTVSLSSTYATVANAANKLPLAGGTMSGAIAMGTNKITGVGDPTNAQDAATKNYIDTVVLAPSNLTGVITSVGNATSIASQTGTGTKFVVDTSPTLVTPVLGVATATSINGTTIPTSKTLVATDSTVYVVPSQGGNSGKFLTTDGTTSTWGTIATNYVSTDGGSTVTASAIGVVPLVLKGASGQTADLLQIQNNAGTNFLSVSNTGNTVLGGGLFVGNAVGASGASYIEVGSNRTANGSALIDLVGDTTYTDYGLRIIRNSGADGGTTIASRGLGDFNISAQDAAAILLLTNNSERMRIDSTGRVGIGMVPTNQLSLGGYGSISAIAGNGTSYLTHQYHDVTGADSWSLANNYLRTNSATGTVTGSTIGTAEIQLLTSGAGSIVGGISFGTSPTINTAPVQRMYIDKSGLVGIGAQSSGSMVSIVNNTTGNYGLLVKGVASQTASLMQFQNSAGVLLVSVSAAGKVGIGITPTADLHVATGSTTNYGILLKGAYLGLAAGSTNNLMYLADSRGDANDGFRFYQYRDTTAPNVGEWQTSSLHIQRNIDGAGYQQNIGFLGNNAMTFGTFGSERMRIDSSGNVSIGSTSAAARLSVIGTGTSAAMPSPGTASGFTFIGASTGTYGLLTGVNYSTGDVWMQAQRIDSNPLAYNILLNPSGGKVGIGTSSPNKQLTIVSAASTAMQVSGNSGTTYTEYGHDNDGGYIYQGSDSKPFRIFTGNALRLNITSDGATTINSIADGTTTTASVGAGYMGIPQNSTTTGSYTLVAADAGKHIYSTATRTVTIPANSSVAYPVGTTLTFISAGLVTTTIAITSDTLILSGSGSTGTRTLASTGMATAVKTASTVWFISGNGLT